MEKTKGTDQGKASGMKLKIKQHPQTYSELAKIQETHEGKAYGINMETKIHPNKTTKRPAKHHNNEKTQKVKKIKKENIFLNGVSENLYKTMKHVVAKEDVDKCIETLGKQRQTRESSK